MKSLAAVMNQPWEHSIGWVLLHSLWQGALVGAAFAFANFLLRRRSANARYIAGCVALARLFAGTIATLLVCAASVSTPLAPELSHGPGHSEINIPPVMAGAFDYSDGSAVSFFRSSSEFLTELTPWLTLF